MSPECSRLREPQRLDVHTVPHLAGLGDSIVFDRQHLLPGVLFERRGDAVSLVFSAPWQSLASAVLTGGRRHARSLVHLHVPQGYACERPEQDLRAAGRLLGLPGPTVGLMTAVDLAETQIFAATSEGISVRALITVGLSNVSRAGGAGYEEPGTINVIVLVEHRLSDAAAVELAMLVAESKAASLVEAGIRTRDGRFASGTSTDAVVVLWQRGPGRDLRHAGSATGLGSIVASMVGTAVGRVAGSTQ
jgi:adenosylcobinamide hydrolase